MRWPWITAAVAATAAVVVALIAVSTSYISSPPSDPLHLKLLDLRSGGGGGSAAPHASELQDAIDRLLYGHVAFNPSGQMRVDRQERIKAVLSVDLPIDQLIAQLDAAGKKESADIRVSDQMVATLEGENFEIAPKGPQSQWISRSGTTEWSWVVTPKRQGEGQFLVLSFDAVIKVGDKEGTRRVRTFTHRMDVDVSWAQTFGTWFDASKHLAESLQWLWAVLLVPAGVLVRRYWQGRRTSSNIGRKE
jgi:hypothetical protein